MSAQPSGRAALERQGELLLGMVALDQAFAAARWIAAGAGFPPAGAAGGGFDPRGFEAARQRVRAVRNVIIHMDERLASSMPATLEIDGSVIRGGQSVVTPPVTITTREWARWLDLLEAWLPESRPPRRVIWLGMWTVTFHGETMGSGAWRTSQPFAGAGRSGGVVPRFAELANAEAVPRPYRAVSAPPDRCYPPFAV